MPATAFSAPRCAGPTRSRTGNTRPRFERCSAHRVRPEPVHRPRSRPVQSLPLRQLASDPSVPVEGGNDNPYVYPADPNNKQDLVGQESIEDAVCADLMMSLRGKHKLTGAHVWCAFYYYYKQDFIRRLNHPVTITISFCFAICGGGAIAFGKGGGVYVYGGYTGWKGPSIAVSPGLPAENSMGAGACADICISATRDEKTGAWSPAVGFGTPGWQIGESSYDKIFGW